MRTAPTRLRDRLARAVTRSVVGRDRELAALTAIVEPGGPVVTFVHGLGGIGKTTLLDALEPRLVERGARVIRLDGRAIEPTEGGFLATLGRELRGSAFDDIEQAAAAITGTTAILVDEVDRLRLLDSWLRRMLLPALHEDARWVFAGRFAPRSEWHTTPGWSDAVATIRLDALDNDAARALLARKGVAEATIARILHLARGNPLALELAATRIAADDDAETVVLDVLAQRCVDELPPRLREAVDAACLVRRTTRPLLEAMLGGPCEDAFLGELAELPFIELTDEGFAVHEAVRSAVAARLRSLDPDRYTELRARAWSVLEDMLERAVPTGPNAWRLTADVLFVVEHPSIHEAFFPSLDPEILVDAAAPGDEQAVLDIVRAHEPAAHVELFAAWWRLLPGAFRIARDRVGVTRGFAIVTPSHRVPAALLADDPLLAAWHADLANSPAASRGALFVRRATSMEYGELPSEVGAALWTDAKRAYVERPAQWSLYYATCREPEVLRLTEPLGFRRSHLATANEATLTLEFGAAGIWTWLRKLVGKKPAAPVAYYLDPPSRGLVVDGNAVPLSALEYGVFEYLAEADGKVVTREELLEHVWKQRHTGSNVVDALVRLLRKKLGRHAAALETVKGHGYRLVAPGTGR